MLNFYLNFFTYLIFYLAVFGRASLFFRCHALCIVHIAHIQSISSGMCVCSFFQKRFIFQFIQSKWIRDIFHSYRKKIHAEKERKEKNGITKTHHETMSALQWKLGSLGAAKHTFNKWNQINWRNAPHWILFFIFQFQCNVECNDQWQRSWANMQRAVDSANWSPDHTKLRTIITGSESVTGDSE